MFPLVLCLHRMSLSMPSKLGDALRFVIYGFCLLYFSHTVMSSNPYDKQKGRGHSQQVFNQGLWSSMFLHVGGDQFTCCSLSIRELVLWTLSVCDRFFLCRITKQYLILKVCYLYKKIHLFLFFFTVTLFFFFLTHCRTLNRGNICKNSWE